VEKGRVPEDAAIMCAVHTRKVLLNTLQEPHKSRLQRAWYLTRNAHALVKSSLGCTSLFKCIFSLSGPKP